MISSPYTTSLVLFVLFSWSNIVFLTHTSWIGTVQIVFTFFCQKICHTIKSYISTFIRWRNMLKSLQLAMPWLLLLLPHFAVSRFVPNSREMEKLFFHRRSDGSNVVHQNTINSFTQNQFLLSNLSRFMNGLRVESMQQLNSVIKIMT